MDYRNGPLANTAKSTNKQNVKELNELLQSMKKLYKSHFIKWQISFIPPEHLRLSKYTYNI